MVWILWVTSGKYCFLTSNASSALLTKRYVLCRCNPVSSHEILPHCRRCRARPGTRYDQILTFLLNIYRGGWEV